MTSRAEKGDVQSLYELGEAYYYGKLVPKKNAKALKCYTKSAAQGHADSRYSLGWIYANGEGVPEDQTVAFK